MDAPVGIPNPVSASIPSGGHIFPTARDHVVGDASAELQILPHVNDKQHGPVPGDVAQVAHVAQVPVPDPYGQLSLPQLNEILEKRLNERLVPKFQPQEGHSNAANAKKFQRV